MTLQISHCFSRDSHSHAEKQIIVECDAAGQPGRKKDFQVTIQKSNQASSNALQLDESGKIFYFVTKPQSHQNQKAIIMPKYSSKAKTESIFSTVFI